MSVEQAAAVLAEVPTFEGLPAEALRSLAVSGEEVALKAGETLFRAGEAADGAYVILSGRLELMSEQAGRRQRLCELLPGALAGERALLIATTHPATARALAASRVLRIPRPLFLRLLEGFPEAAAALQALFGARVQDTLAALETVRAEKLDTPLPSRARKR
ncbi:cyclic nucleotide-binding domain-containing protein [Aquabacter cavernae]|uniref:cyclic nucleotide-binding domain-containing protein n=1 Tax=Aquabacter cavernae TaxID=2496029 RepID=UPI0013E09A9F|nr:cyclic nucleotide-binding domain-containing protein [Aquabacter cavernae]